MRLILKQGVVLAGVGVVLGLALAAAAGQLVQSLLFGISGVLAVDAIVALRNE